ncbi:cyclin-dependent kinase regulatory subunit [Bombardia bombarda]|uniref:Cyclin-dependent kinases regulatory subunit n=1 Tax=Bombardia bombarda TaxID=252184 RepID=A0AA39XAE0_9PEZI|nr:cyclin-dependent kinase regulatory subunit [Bombardia bombarda]
MGIDTKRRNPKPRSVTDEEFQKLQQFGANVIYSPRYADDEYEYRHVQLPKAMLKEIPRPYFVHPDSEVTMLLKLLWEDEWRAMGITQSLGWEHYEVHEPEPHILLFKRPLNYQPPK